MFKVQIRPLVTPMRKMTTLVLVGHMMVSHPAFANSAPYTTMVNTMNPAESKLEMDMDSIKKIAGVDEALEIQQQIEVLEREIADLEDQEETLGVESVIHQIKSIQEHMDQILRLSHLY